ncbi:MAG: hypothetical protein ACLFU4_04245 [Opitutales bacterium]
MKTVKLLSLVAALVSASSAPAAITITISESGSDLLMETSGGSLNLSGVTKTADVSVNPAPAGIFPPDDQYTEPGVYAGGNAGTSNYHSEYIGSVTYSGSPMSGSGFSEADSVSILGGYFAADAALGYVNAPTNYTSGDNITASAIIFSERSFSDIGWSAGDSGTWSWGSGSTADSITLTAVPESSQYPIVFAVVALGFCLSCQRKQR